MTRAVERLNIDWPAERVRSKSRLDECFSPSRAQPQCRRLPHRGVEIMGENGFLLSSYRVLKKEKVTERCRRWKRPSRAISPLNHLHLLDLVLPTYPVRTTSALVGKAYSAAGQAAACLHTMSLS